MASQQGQEETGGEIGVGRDTTAITSRVIPIQVVDTPDSAGGDRDSPDDLEKEETRRTAQRVFSKQG